ncbi:MAG: LuxR C-terminal-related transcriptional regulator [Ktedonobacteraceae bacterium]
METNIKRDELDVLLATKLYLPPARPDHVDRPRLFAALAEGTRHKLTLISAAAGFGKTALVSAWVATHPAAVAWVSLDEGDNDPTLFWKYVVASLDAIQPALSKQALPILHALPPLPIEAFLTVLINAVTTISRDFVLVLDEYQSIDTPAIHDALAFLLDHMPPQMHVLIASRSEPPLPLARLRVRGQLTELRTPDLRFTQEETARFLRQGARLDLSSEDILALQARTEGWIAGLHLAALSLQGGEHTQDFIAAFTGSNRYVLEYLVEEVLSRQPEHVQAFLLQTSLLERVSGPLCDALTGHTGGQAMLEYLEEANLFLLPLDAHQSWYRYHRLFAEAMRQKLQRTQADHVSKLYQKASFWYEQHGFFVDAVETALTGQHYAQAARLIERINAAMMRRGETATLLRWLRRLPDEVVRSSPGLCICFAWVLYLAVQFDASEVYIAYAETLPDTYPDAVSRPVDKATQEAAEIAALRAVIAVSRQDIPHVIEFAQYALQYLAQENVAGRALVTWALGVASWFNDDVEAAIVAVTESLALGQAADSVSAVLNALGDLVQLQFAQGRLHQAEKTCQQGLQFVTKHREQLPATNSMQIAFGDLQRERNELASAAHALSQGLEQDQQIWNLGNTLRGYIALARTKQAQGDAVGAREAIDRAERVAQQSHMPHLVAIVRAYRARILLLQGAMGAVHLWLQESNIDGDGTPLHHTREVEYLTLARVYIAQDKAEDALRLLARLLQAAERGKRMGSVIEILALAALAHARQGTMQDAVTALARALSYAESEGYVRVFADEGAPMAALLKRLLDQQQQGRLTYALSRDYIKHLLSALENKKHAASAQDTQKTSQPLVEPLSQRELEVLHLIADGASNREIAERLVVSLGTVKKHLNNIFGKLAVKNRTQAVAEARNLGLLS